MTLTSGYPATDERNLNRLRETESGGWPWREKVSEISWSMWVFSDLHVAREKLGRERECVCESLLVCVCV